MAVGATALTLVTLPAAAFALRPDHHGEYGTGAPPAFPDLVLVSAPVTGGTAIGGFNDVPPSVPVDVEPRRLAWHSNYLPWR